MSDMPTSPSMSDVSGSASSTDASHTPGGPMQPRLLIQRSGRQMATDVSVQIATRVEDAAAAETAADACMAWFDEVDQRLSRFRPESELSRLNAASGREFAATATLFDAVTVAVAAARASHGLFDPTLLRQLEALGYDRDFALLVQQDTDDMPVLHAVSSADELHEPPLARAAWNAIALDPARRRITLPEGVGIDLGGIAKGWAADVALARYGARFPGALINVGGDLRAHGGPQPGESWSVGIRHPRFELATRTGLDPMSSLAEPPQTQYTATVTFSRGGLATSGALRRWWLRNGRREHHLLDPRTGRPMRVWMDGDDMPEPGSAGAERLIATATALAPTAARAEVAAKVALLRGYPDALRYVETAWERYGAVGPETDADAGIALVLTFGDGEVALSSNLSAYLATWGTAGAALPMNVLSS